MKVAVYLALIRSHRSPRLCSTRCSCTNWATTTAATGVTASWIVVRASRYSSSNYNRNCSQAAPIPVATRRNCADPMRRTARANMATNVNLLTAFTSFAVSFVIRNTRRNCVAPSTRSDSVRTDPDATLFTTLTRHATVRLLLQCLLHRRRHRQPRPLLRLDRRLTEANSRCPAMDRLRIRHHRRRRSASRPLR